MDSIEERIQQHCSIGDLIFYADGSGLMKSGKCVGMGHVGSGDMMRYLLINDMERVPLHRVFSRWRHGVEWRFRRNYDTISE